MMTKNLAFFGYGLRSQTMMQAFRDIEAEIAVSAVADPDWERIQAENAADPLFAGTRYFPDAQSLLRECEPDGVFIGTRCPLHTPLAVEVLNRDIPMFLEKPVCIDQTQYQTLRAAADGKLHRAVVSFPLRVTDITVRLRQLVESGALGQITMVQAVNNVPYGSVYYHNWYRDPTLTGGLFLQKATHDIDYICHVAGLRPKQVFAHTEKLYYKGDKPAGLHCPDCSEYRSCAESSYVVGKLRGEEVQGDCCCFAVDTGNEDAASAMYLCENGAIISYSQNFIVKRTAARRGCRIIGTRGSAEFDFYTGEIRHDDYAFDQTAIIRIRPTGGTHFGGDRRLAQDFMQLLAGGRPASDLAGGLRSAACCLAAKQSAETGKLVDILP